MLAKLTILFLFAAAASSLKTIPSIVPLCKRSDPNVAQCVKSAVESLRPALKQGIPELGLPSIDPISFKEVTLFKGDNNGTSGLTFKAYLKDIQAYGGSDFELLKLKMDTQRNTYRCAVNFPKILIRGDFFLGAGFIADTGKFVLEVTKPESQAVIKAEITENGDHRQINFTSINFNIKIKDYTLNFEENFRGIEFLRSMLDQIIRSNKNEFLQIALPFAERKIAEVFLDAANKVSADLDYDQVFPEK